MTPAQLLLLALLHFYPHMSGNNRACIEQRQTAIVQAVETAERDYGVPPAVLLAVGLSETHLGCDPGEGGNWGAPIDARHRHTPGTANTAARILQRGMQVCPQHTWLASISRFRSGFCTIPRSMAGYPRTVLWNITRFSQNAGIPVPNHLR